MLLTITVHFARAFGSHPRGREFESLQVHQNKSPALVAGLFVLANLPERTPAQPGGKKKFPVMPGQTEGLAERGLQLQHPNLFRSTKSEQVPEVGPALILWFARRAPAQGKGIQRRENHITEKLKHSRNAGCSYNTRISSGPPRAKPVLWHLAKAKCPSYFPEGRSA